MDMMMFQKRRLLKVQKILGVQATSCSVPYGLCCFTGSNLMRRNVTWMAKDLVLHSISAAFCLICCRHMLTLEYVILGAPDVG